MQNNLANNKRIAKNTLLLYIRMAFVLLVSLYTSRVVLQTLGVEDFGVYNVVAGFVSMFAILNSALNTCIQRFYNYEIGKIGETGLRNVYNTSLIIQFILAIIAFIAAESFGLWYLENKLVVPDGRLYAAKALFHVSLLSMCMLIIQVPYSAAILAKERMDYYALVGVLEVLLKLGIVVALPYLPFDKLITYAWLTALVSMIDFLLYFIYAKIQFKQLRFHFDFNKGLFVSMMKFSGWSALSGFSQLIRNQGLNIVLNLFFGPVVNAARGISYQIKTAMMGFIQNISTAARPQLVESYAQGNVDRSQRLMYTVTKISFIMLYMMVLPVCYEINLILNIWLGDTVPEYTAIFSILILAITLVDILQTPITMIVYADGRIGAYNVWTSLLGLLVLPAAYFTLKCNANPILVYIISLGISLIIQIASMILMKKVVGFNLLPYIKDVILPLLMVTVMTCMIPYLIVLLFEDSFLRLIIVTIVAILTIVSIGYFVALDKTERELVKSYFIKISRKFAK